MTGESMTWSWAEVGARYQHLDTPAGEAIVALCTFIDTRPIRSGVHGWASLLGLGISQVPVWRFDAPHLWLELKTDTVEFSYRDTQIPTRMWTRVESADRVIERFRRTMIQLGWFTDRSALD